MDLLLEKKWPEAAIFVVPQNQTQKRILLTVSQPLPSLHLHPYRELFAFFDPDIVFVRSSLWSCSADYCPFSPWHSFIVLFLRYELITESTWKIKYFFLKRKIPRSKISNMISTSAEKSDFWKSIKGDLRQGDLNRFYPPCKVNAGSDVLVG